MESVNVTSRNIDKIGALFPNCITETVDKKVLSKTVWDLSFGLNN